MDKLAVARRVRPVADTNIYNFSAARIVQDTERAGIEP
jgi:hypothetical protein